MYVCIPVCRKATCGNIAVCNPLKINHVYRKKSFRSTVHQFHCRGESIFIRGGVLQIYQFATNLNRIRDGSLQQKHRNKER